MHRDRHEQGSGNTEVARGRDGKPSAAAARRQRAQHQGIQHQIHPTPAQPGERAQIHALHRGYHR